MQYMAQNPSRRYLILTSTTTYRKHMLIYSHLFPDEHHLSFSATILNQWKAFR
jgi:hypothetical protein